MRRSLVWAAIVVAALVVLASPASAAVASVNTTAADFEDGSLSNFIVEGSGETASAVARIGEQESVSYSLSSGVNVENAGGVGVVFSLSADRPRLEATTVYSSAVELRYHSNGTLIATDQPDTNGDVAFDEQLVSGVQYRLVSVQDDPYTTREASVGLPDTNGSLTIENGYRNGNLESGTVYAFTNIATTFPDSATYTGAEHQADADTLFADIDPGGGSATVRAQANTGSGWSDVATTTVSSAQNASLDISGSSATRYRAVVEASSTGAQTVTIDAEGVTFAAASPSLSDPSPQGSTAGYDGDISVNVSDADFGLAQGDVVTVNATSAQTGYIGETQTNANGTVSIEYGAAAGANNITWTAVDEYGNTATINQDFETNSDLVFVNESNTSQIVGSPITVEVTIIGENRTVERSSDTGRVSLEGIPVTAPVIADVRPQSNYSNRVIYIPSLTEQSRAYLLNTSLNTIETRFELQDPTAQFSAESLLIIQKPINESGSVSYQTVYADRFGVEGVTATLEEDARYRLRVRSVDGVSQDIGPYRADVSETVTVQPGSPSIPIGNYSAGWDTGASLDNTTLEYRYADPDNETDSVTVWIHEKGDRSNQLVPNQTYFNLGEAQGSAALTANESEQTWVVNFVIDRDGTERVAQETVANQPNLTPALSTEWRLIFGIGILLISAGMFSVLNAGVGGVVVAVEGGVLWWTGWLSGATTGAAVVLALMIAAFAHLYKSRR